MLYFTKSRFISFFQLLNAIFQNFKIALQIIRTSARSIPKTFRSIFSVLHALTSFFDPLYTLLVFEECSSSVSRYRYRTPITPPKIGKRNEGGGISWKFRTGSNRLKPLSPPSLFRPPNLFLVQIIREKENKSAIQVQRIDFP